MKKFFYIKGSEPYNLNVGLKMRLTVFLTIVCLFQIQANTYSQNKKISLDMPDATVEEVIQKIESLSDFKFLLNRRDVDLDREVSIKVEKQKIATVLSELFRGTKVGYEVLKKQIVLKKMSDKVESSAGSAGLTNHSDNESAQFQVSGTVTDTDGTPLPGTNVLEKGTTNGVQTDFDGNFSIGVVDENVTLVFSYIGFASKEVQVNGQDTVNVQLEESAQGLDEVVVVGYGEQKMENVIGSVSKIKSEDITSAPVTNVSNALAGRVPGAIIQQTNGEPGNNAANITIRGTSTLGNSSPLIVVDGIPGRELNTINASDIDNITVLKDAAAAIYGARAANGVVLVTTKRGKKDTAASFDYSYNHGILTPTVLPEMADAPTYAQMIREMQSYRGIDESNRTFSEEDIDKYRSGLYPWTYPNTDWYDAALADFSTTTSHDLSVSGGSKSITYYGSLGKESADGIYKNSGTSYDRYNLNANIEVNVSDHFRFGIDINGSLEKRLSSTKSTGDIYSSLIRSYPTGTAVWPNGLPGPDIEYGDNPVITPSFQTGFNDDRQYRSYNKVSATYDIPSVEGLSLSGYYAYDVYFQKTKLFEKPWTLYDLDEAAYLADGNTGSEDGSAYLNGTSKGFSEPRLTDSYSNSTTSNLNFTINYEKTIRDFHNITAFVAYENSEFTSEGISAFRRFFISDKLPYLFAGGNAQKDNSGTVAIDARENYFGRFNYNFKETYLFQFTFRRDGSIRFSEENGRWGNFPAVLLGWRTSNESFWKNNVSFIDYFKLKASWGRLGNDLVDPFQYLSGYSFGTGGVFGANKLYSASLYQSVTPNPFITWEVANMYNLGFESRFLENKITLNADFFYQRRSDILVQRNASVPDFTGISLPDENFGIVDSKGFEIVLGYDESKEDFSYGINANLAFARNEIIEFDEPARNVPWQVRTGHPQGADLVYRSAGIFTDEAQINSLPHVSGARPGDIIIVDYDGDGEITNDDRILLDKTANPEITYGVSFNLKYKNWGFSGLVQGVGNATRRIYNDDRQGSGGNYFQYDADGRWTPDNIDATKPRAFERTEEYWRGSHVTDYSYTNTAYARMKNAQISFEFPKNVQDQIELTNAQIYLSGQNLFFLSNKSKIMDPELGSDSSYPLMRVLSLGLRVGF